MQSRKPAPGRRPPPRASTTSLQRRGSIAHGPAAPATSLDCEALMDYRTPLQHLLQRFLLSRAQAPARTPAQDFEDTRPDDSRARRPAALRPVASVGRSQSTIDLVLGT